MQVDEINEYQLRITFGEYEAAILAATCQIASIHAEGSVPKEDPFGAYPDKALLAALLESWSALFEALGVGTYCISEARTADQAGLTLSALRAYRSDDRHTMSPAERAAKVKGSEA